MTPEEAKVKQVQDDAMSGMKAKWSMLNGNRLDETLRTLYYSSQSYSSYGVLLFALGCYSSLALLRLKLKG